MVGRRRLLIFPLLCAALCCTGLYAQETGRGRHKRMFAVPVPGPLTIDGRLDDWDLSGQIEMYVMAATRETQSAKFALMHDEGALYLSGAVRDATPMMNRHDPHVDGDKGWDADACQFRIVVDPGMGYPVRESGFDYRGADQAKDTEDEIVHLTLWYYTDRSEANLQMQVGMGFRLPRPEWAPHGVVPRDMFEGAYVKWQDGRGYTFEYRIPWTTLGARRPLQGGDLVAGTVQLNWSRPDGLRTAGGSAWAYDVMAYAGFPWQTCACWGKMVFAEEGNVPRGLVELVGEAEKPLPLTFEYDLPEDAEVTVALLDSRKMLVRNIAVQAQRRAGHVVEQWDGLDEEGSPLPAGQYTWKGLYHQPITTKFVMSVHNSGQPPYKSDDNTGGWGADHGAPTTVCAAGDSMLLAWSACEAGWGIVRTDLNGRKQWGSQYSATCLATDGERFFAAGGHGFHKTAGVLVFALDDGRPLNFGSGQPVAAPPDGGNEQSNTVTGIACHEGILYVAFRERDLIGAYDAAEGTLRQTWTVPRPGRLAVHRDGTLLAVSGSRVVALADGAVRMTLATHLDAPAGLAVDAGGRIYVANQGKLQNISVFSPRGDYLRSIGKRGGRPWRGRYDKAGMLQPDGIAVDEQGKLWVAENLDAPRRISMWSASAGRLVQEFFGGCAYGSWLWMDPKRPGEVYCHNVIWKVDLDRRTWSPYSTIWRARAPDEMPAPSVGSSNGHLRVVTASNGRQFAWGQQDYGHKVYMRDGDVFKPIAGVITLARTGRLAGEPMPALADAVRFPDGVYLWQDANDDQSVQPEEVLPAGVPKPSCLLNWIDEDLNAWCDNGAVFRPVRFEGKRPIYDFTKPETTPFVCSNSNALSQWRDPDGSMYTVFCKNGPAFAKWTVDGTLLWGLMDVPPWRDALSRPPLQPGKVWGPFMPLGVAGDYTGTGTYFGPFQILTRDGLCVAMVFRDGRLGGGLGPDIIACEAFAGQLVKPEGMDRYFILAGDQDGRITEVLGLDTVRRLPGGTYAITEEDAGRAAAALQQYLAQKARAQRLVIVRGRKALAASEPVTKLIDADRSFAVRAAYDDANLYVSFDVRSPHELVNAITEPKLIFKGGNLLDIQMATDPAADANRTRPAPGDVRILVSRREGEAVAVLFRPKARAFQGEPTVLTSPTGTEAFDAIETRGEIGLEYAGKGADAFVAVVTIPLQVLGWTPQPGRTVKMDVGYIFGNATGTRAMRRSYWTNNSFSANVLNDVPNESRLEPRQWGEAEVE